MVAAHALSPADPPAPRGTSADSPLTSSPAHLFTSSSLSPTDALRLHALAENHFHPFKAAEATGTPPEDFLLWRRLPHIAREIALLESEFNTAAHHRAIADLQHSIATTDNQVERRRAASNILRATTARARLAVTTRAKAGAAPAEREPRPTSPLTSSPAHLSTASSPSTPRHLDTSTPSPSPSTPRHLDTSTPQAPIAPNAPDPAAPAHLADLNHRANQATADYIACPPRATKEDLVTHVTACADAWQAHNARQALATADPSPTPTPPSPSSPPPSIPRNLDTSTPLQIPQSKIQNLKSKIDSLPSAAQTVKSLQAALAHFNSPTQGAGAQALFSLTTPDFRWKNTALTDPLPAQYGASTPHQRLAARAKVVFNHSTPLNPIEIQEPTHEALARATPESPITLTYTLKLRRGQASPRLQLTLTRAGQHHPWLIKSIDEPRPP